MKASSREFRAGPLGFLVMLVASLSVTTLAAPPASGLGVGGVKGGYDSIRAVISADGQHIAFHSHASNLHPYAEGLHIYARNLNTGTTELVDRASGANGASGEGAAHSPSISADGRYVAFDSPARNIDPADPAFVVDVFVRDLQEHTTTLVSRATGAGGPKGNAASTRASISADGRYVAFQSKANNLTSDGVLAGRDNIYLRDLQANTTTLVSRASGVSGAPANSSYYPSISANGRRVAFESAANLDPADADPDADVWVRDLDANTTTLVSRASGAAGIDGNGWAGDPVISGDGNTVAFDSSATNLDPADQDSMEAVFARDMQAATTSLVSRADGVMGAVANDWATYPFVTHDGGTVGFNSTATNLTAADLESDFDVFLRDLQAGTTTLVSRAGGQTGTNQPGAAFNDGKSMSADARFVPFNFNGTGLHPDDTDATADVYVRDLQEYVTSLESRATPGYERYVRPAGATPLRASLVPAYAECVTANRTHGPPLAYGSCAPPGPVSPRLTVGERDIGRSIGYVRFAVQSGPPDETGEPYDYDVFIRLSLTNVMHAADFSDYTGELRASVRTRLTDNFDDLPGRGEETVTDFPFGFTVPCVGTASTAGATCSVSTTADAVIPGFARFGARSVYGMDRFELYDGGPDQDGDTADNSLFAVQGIFVP